MEDRTRGAFTRWRENVGELEAVERAEAARPGGKPFSLRTVHWQAYKAVLSDLMHDGRISNEEAMARLGRLRMTSSVSALRGPGPAYVHVTPRRD